VVGRFLEHSRIYYFLNGGDEEVYIGSGDLMERNLDRRVEVIRPINDPTLKRHLRDVVLEALLIDTHRAWQLQIDGRYARVWPTEGVEALNSQQHLLEWYSKNTLLQE
jgi:polyphosphate kinase